MLERDNQSVSLTPLGQRLLNATTDFLQTHDRILGKLHGTHLAGRITLGVPDEYAAHVIRDILPVFAATWPNVVLHSPSSQAIYACVEAGLGISLIDRARVTPNMQILDGFPLIPEHEVVLVRSAKTVGNEAVDLLSEALLQRFQL